MPQLPGVKAIHVLCGALACASVAVAGLGAFALLRPDLVLVEHVEFGGQDRAHSAALRHLADIRNGTTMWGVDLQAAARGVERHPWVRSAEAHRVWTDTVRIEVTEYEPVALLHYAQADGSGDLLYVARDGTVFLRARSETLDYPVITGVDVELNETHPQLPRLVLRDGLWLLDALDDRNLIAAGAVDRLDFSRSRGFTVHTGQAEVVFGFEQLPQRVERLRALLSEDVDLDMPVYIDLAPANVAIVRPRIRPQLQASAAQPHL